MADGAPDPLAPAIALDAVMCVLDARITTLERAQRFAPLVDYRLTAMIPLTCPACGHVSQPDATMH